MDPARVVCRRGAELGGDTDSGPDRPGGHLVPVAQRLGDLWVGALFAFDTLASVYTPTGADSGTGLFNTDSTVLEAFPESRYAVQRGKNFASAEVLRRALALPAGGGIIVAPSISSNKPNVVAVRRVTGYPMVSAAWQFRLRYSQAGTTGGVRPWRWPAL